LLTCRYVPNFESLADFDGVDDRSCGTGKGTGGNGEKDGGCSWIE
jgi:hypothetical protein